MESKDIIEGSKAIAEYLGWKYIPFNDLQGFPKAGWWRDQSILKWYPKNGRVQIKNGTAIYVCRKHDELRFYNSMDSLLPVIDKLRKEDLKEYFYKWEHDGEPMYNFNYISFSLWDGACYSEVELDLDPPMDIASNFDEGSWVKNTFKTVVETIKFIEQVKTKTDE